MQNEQDQTETTQQRELNAKLDAASDAIMSELSRRGLTKSQIAGVLIGTAPRMGCAPEMLALFVEMRTALTIASIGELTTRGAGGERGASDAG